MMPNCQCWEVSCHKIYSFNSMSGSLRKFPVAFFWKRKSFLPKSSLFATRQSWHCRQVRAVTMSSWIVAVHFLPCPHPNTILASSPTQFTWTEEILEMAHDKNACHCRQVRAVKLNSQSALPALSPPKHLPCIFSDSIHLVILVEFNLNRGDTWDDTW